VSGEILNDLADAVRTIYRRLDESGRDLIVEVLNEHGIEIADINDSPENPT
jgi:hypothetical protein